MILEQSIGPAAIRSTPIELLVKVVANGTPEADVLVPAKPKSMSRGEYDHYLNSNKMVVLIEYPRRAVRVCVAGPEQASVYLSNKLVRQDATSIEIRWGHYSGRASQEQP